jgi:hypothetical protein
MNSPYASAALNRARVATTQLGRSRRRSAAGQRALCLINQDCEAGREHNQQRCRFVRDASAETEDPASGNPGLAPGPYPGYLRALRIRHSPRLAEGLLQAERVRASVGERDRAPGEHMARLVGGDWLSLADRLEEESPADQTSYHLYPPRPVSPRTRPEVLSTIPTRSPP